MEIAARLLSWYRAGHRDLPWRQTHDPFAIWVSEIMLQQTQVATVVPYYTRFLERFPTVAALAAAPEDEVLRAWSGLGYYSRARNLQRGAREVMARHNGQIPATAEELQRLSGIGRYTAGAIASIAFGQRAPILDGNVIRVLCRLYALHGDPKRAPLHARLWQLAEELIPAGDVGDFNQALMELGATVCTPVAPRCDACPLAEQCEARRLGLQQRLPELARAPAPTPLRMAAAVIWRGTDVLLVKRPPLSSDSRQSEDQRWWAGMWQFPSGPVAAGETTAAAAVRLTREATGLTVTPGGVAGVVRHGVTRYRITLEARHCRPESSDPAPGGVDWCWTSLEETGRFALPAPQRRLVEQLRRKSGEQPLLVEV